METKQNRKKHDKNNVNDENNEKPKNNVKKHILVSFQETMILKKK